MEASEARALQLVLVSSNVFSYVEFSAISSLLWVRHWIKIEN